MFRHDGYAAIGHRHHRLIGPVSEQMATEFVESMPLRRGARVLDASPHGEGWGARLRKRWGCEVERPRANGTALYGGGAHGHPHGGPLGAPLPDPAAHLVEDRRARVAAAARAVTRPGLEEPREHADLLGFVAHAGSYEGLVCVGAPFGDGTVHDHLVVGRELLAPGGLYLLGAGYWRLPPSRSYLKRSGYRPGEMLSLGATLARAAESGFEVEHWASCPRAEWDRYERHFRDSLLDWADEHRGDARAQEVRFRAEGGWRLYEMQGRHVLGFALLVLRAE